MWSAEHLPQRTLKARQIVLNKGRLRSEWNLSQAALVEAKEMLK